MKAKTIGYWGTTSILIFVVLAGGAAQLARRPENVDGLVHLGYPVYLLTILGAWKVLGAITLAVPGFPRLKEWAYAGIFFDLTGAGFSHAAAGDDTRHVLVPFLFAAISVASWALRPASRTIAGKP